MLWLFCIYKLFQLLCKNKIGVSIVREGIQCFFRNFRTPPLIKFCEISCEAGQRSFKKDL